MAQEYWDFVAETQNLRSGMGPQTLLYHNLGARWCYKQKQKPFTWFISRVQSLRIMSVQELADPRIRRFHAVGI